MDRDKNLRGILIFIFYLLFSTYIYGCGYTTRSILPSHFRKLYVPTFINRIKLDKIGEDYRTYYPGLEIKLTEAVINRFLYDGNLRISKEEEADLILEGEIVEYLRQPLRYSEANAIEEYRLSLMINLNLKNRRDEVIWKETNFIGDTTYRLSGPLAKTEAEALEDLVEDLARRIVNRTLEGW